MYLFFFALGEVLAPPKCLPKLCAPPLVLDHSTSKILGENSDYTYLSLVK